MSNFTYMASGSLTLGGCSEFRATRTLYYAFAIGSFVYNKDKAMKGIYEKVVIKKIHFVGTYVDPLKSWLVCLNCNLTPIYTDTFNAVWDEDDLVSYSDATVLINEYFELQDILAKEAALKCL